MEYIDEIQINFNPNQLRLLNLCLAFLMFGIALDIKLGDFQRLFKSPKVPLVGLFSEYILLPLLTIILILIFRPYPSIALGMILIATCPGGSTSNYMVHLSKGNTALSVLLTSITTLGAVIITPLTFSMLSSWIPYLQETAQQIQVNFWDMLKTIFQLVLLPVGLGIVFNHQFPSLVKKIEPYIRRLSLLIFLAFVVVAIFKNLDNLKDYVHIVFFLVLIHNTLALAIGYGFGKLNGLNETDARAVALETGIQNTGLGLILVFNFFNGMGGMALILAWWGIWHLISGFALSSYWGRRPSMDLAS